MKPSFLDCFDSLVVQADRMRVLLPAPGDQQAAGNKDWSKNWVKEWVITVGLQRARIDYPVLPLDSSGQPVDTKAAAK